MVAPDGIERRGLDFKPEARRKPHATQQPQMVLAESRVRVADRPDDAARQIAASIHEIQHASSVRVHHQSVDGEVAAQHVLAGVGLEADVLGMPAVQVIVIAAEGGHLHLVEHVAHQDYSEMRPHPPRAREEIHDAVRPRVRRDIEVFGFHSQQQVAHTPAYQERLVSHAAQLGDHLACQRFRVHLPMLI